MCFTKGCKVLIPVRTKLQIRISILLVASKGYKRLSMLLLPTPFEEDVSDFLINWSTHMSK